jgi:hypothetical protein
MAKLCLSILAVSGVIDGCLDFASYLAYLRSILRG